MKRTRLSPLLLIVALWGAAGDAQASLLRAMSLDQLVTSASQIVVGQVVSKSAAWDPSHRRIFSTIEIKTQECWKGSARETITIVQPGGTVGDIEMTVHGMPRFTVGERMLLFLRGHTQFQVVGMSVGKRPLAWDAAGKRWLVESADTENVVDVDITGRLRHALPAARLDLEAMRAQVRSLVKD